MTQVADHLIAESVFRGETLVTEVKGRSLRAERPRRRAEIVFQCKVK